MIISMLKSKRANDPEWNEFIQLVSAAVREELDASQNFYIGSSRNTSISKPGSDLLPPLKPVPQLPPRPDEEAVYDRGWGCWSQVIVAHLLVVNGFGYLSSFGLFQSYWTERFDKTENDISWAGSIQIFLLFFVGTFSGRIMDAGYFRPLLYVGCATQLLAVFCTSFVNNYWQMMLAQGITQGLSQGMLFTPAVTLVSTHFMKRRAFALSIAACGAPVGGVIFPTIARSLGPTIGMPWATRIMGFVMLFNVIFTIFLAHPRPTARKGALIELSAFKEPLYLTFNIGCFLSLWGVYIAYFYTSSYGKDVVHMSSSESLVLLMVLNAVGIPGRLIPAYVADRWAQPLTVLIPSVLCAGTMLYCWAAAKTTGSFVAFVIIYGVSANAVQTLFPSSLSGLTKDMSKMGSRVGMGFTAISFACLTGAPIAGALIDSNNGNYLYAQIFGGTSMVLGTCTLGFARWLKGNS